MLMPILLFANTIFNLSKELNSSALLRPILNGAKRGLNTKEEFLRKIKRLIVVGSFTWGPKAKYKGISEGLS